MVSPAAPDDEQPGSGEDTDGVGVVVASGAGAVVEIGGPGICSAGVCGELGDGVARLFVACPAESDGAELAGLSREGCGAGQAGQRFRGWNLARASPISVSRRAARTLPERGRLVNTCWSACRAGCSLIWGERSLICSTRMLSTVSSARVMWACVMPCSPRAPRGAAGERGVQHSRVDPAAVADAGQSRAQTLGREPVGTVSGVEAEGRAAGRH